MFSEQSLFLPLNNLLLIGLPGLSVLKLPDLFVFFSFELLKFLLPEAFDLGVYKTRKIE